TAVASQAQEIRRLSEVVSEKDTAVASQAQEIGRLYAALLEKNEALQASSAEAGRYVEMLRIAHEERAYFYAEIQKRDILLEQASHRHDQLKAELNGTTAELQAIRLTRWFRLREALLSQPFGPRKIVQVLCIAGAPFIPLSVRRRLAPKISALLALKRSTIAVSAGGAYRVKQARQPRGNAPHVVHAIANVMTGGSSRLVVDLLEHLGGSYRQQVLTSYIPDPPAYVGMEIEEYRSPEDVAPFIAYFKRIRPQLVHVHYWGDCDEPWYASVIDAARQLGLPIIENVNTPIAPHYSDAVIKYVYVSDYVRNVFGTPDPRHVTVYPGSNFELFTRGNGEYAPDDCVGMVYRLEPDKLKEDAILPFIRMVQMRPKTRILIVGGGSLLEPFRQAVAAAGVANNFEFTGYVSYGELPGLYRQMSLFIAPVWKESFGQVGPFAMSMKVPVIGYDVGAIGEIVGTPDLLAPAGNAERLAQIAVELLDAPDRRRTLGESLQLRARQHFSVQAMIDHYARLYVDAIESHRKETV
ncbi:MAG: glycosyltransferase family 4 protein, partial [Burkholderiales bacterium]|nr:glycosyltransferase family 4 protein [Burkholderiales bacterium]